MLRRRGPAADAGPGDHPLPRPGRGFGRRTDRSPAPLRDARPANREERTGRLHRRLASAIGRGAPPLVRLRRSARPPMSFRLGQAILLLAGAAAALPLFIPWTPWA